VAIALARQMLYRNSAKDHPLEAHKVDSLAIYYLSLKDGKEGVQSFHRKSAHPRTSRSAPKCRRSTRKWSRAGRRLYRFVVKYMPLSSIN